MLKISEVPRFFPQMNYCVLNGPIGGKWNRESIGPPPAQTKHIPIPIILCSCDILELGHFYRRSMLGEMNNTP